MAIKQMKLLWFPITIAMVFFVGLAALVYRTRNMAITTPLATPTATSNQASSGSVYINSNYEIMVKAPNSVLSAIAVRLSYESGNKQEIKPALEINKDLAGQNWIYPVKEVSLGEDGKVLKVDLAAVNVAPEGYKIDSEIKLATLNFGDNKPSLANFKFDSGQTKVITKNGEEVNLELSK
jgi:hypothetical protein